METVYIVSLLVVLLMDLAIPNNLGNHPIPSYHHHNHLIPTYVNGLTFRERRVGVIDIARSNCSQDYFPCSCEAGIDSIVIVCVNISVTEIQNVFKSTYDLEVFAFYMETTSPLTKYQLPFDFLANKHVLNIALLSKVFTFPRPSLLIDPSAFRFTRRDTKTFRIENWDMGSQENFNFLNDFEILEELYIHRNANISGFESLPVLPALTTLYIVSCPTLSEISFPDLTPARLKRLIVASNRLGDTKVSEILVSVGASSSANSIEQLDFNDNRLSSVPRQIRSFSQLNVLSLSRNNLSVIYEYSMIFSTPVIAIDLSYCEITFIETGAFEGNFTSATINLEGNELTQFAEEVFKEILKQMASSQLVDPTGFIDIKSNPFDCGCDLAWLIRDNRQWLTAVHNGVCVNSTTFEQLDPTGFHFCP